MKIKKTKEDRVLSVVLFLILGFLCFVMAYPIYYIVCYSLSDPAKITPGFLWFVKGIPSLQSYADVFAFGGIPQAFLISVLRCVCSPLLMLIVTLPAAYALSKPGMYFRKVVLLILTMTMYIDAGMIPNYMRISSLNLNHTFWVYVIPGAFSAFNLILVKTYMEGIPAALEESAYVDGSGYFRTFFYIVLPICKPVIATITLFAIVGQWNTYMDTMLYNAEDSALHTISYVLMQFVQNTVNLFEQTRNQSGELARQVNTNSLKMAITTISILPIACVYPFLQKYFVKGIMIGAVKG